ncbi:potassium-transporting ATPase subunit F [Streptomyces goshikiensis]
MEESGTGEYGECCRHHRAVCLVGYLILALCFPEKF